MNDDHTPAPDLVLEAEALAKANGFTGSCTRRTGSLLRTLAAAAEGTILELGSGCGVGSAWLASGLRPGSELVTVESDGRRHEVLGSLFDGRDDVVALRGGWRDALVHGPFALAFVDVSEAKDDGSGEVVEAMSIGGVMLLDDFTPGPLYRGQHDERWHRWMREPRLASCEILTAPGVAAIVATRIG